MKYLLSILFIFSSLAHATDNKKLADLEAAIRATHSDAFILYQNGQILSEIGSDRIGVNSKIEAMSATKSVVSLAIGFLLQDHFIASIDTPVYKFYPEWHQGLKQMITIRHLLNHTSGLQANATTQDIYRSPDFIRYALNAEVITTPGEVFFYNNKAVNILSGIVQRASGERLDLYLKRKLFSPLGIKDFTWSTDSVGNPQAMAGLQIKAVDFIKIGLLIMNKGALGNHQIIDLSWIRESFTPSAKQPNYGLLWWLSDNGLCFYNDALINRYAAAGLNRIVVAKLRQMVPLGKMRKPKMVATMLKVLGSMDELMKFAQFTVASKLPKYLYEPGKIRSFAAEGYLGQYLVIIPGKNMVAIRMIDRSSYTSSNDDYQGFMDDLLDLF